MKIKEIKNLNPTFLRLRGIPIRIKSQDKYFKVGDILFYIEKTGRLRWLGVFGYCDCCASFAIFECDFKEQELVFCHNCEHSFSIIEVMEEIIVGGNIFEGIESKYKKLIKI